MSLHEAVQGGDEEIAASLVEQGASVSDKDENGDTPLHIAASKGSVATTLLLLKRGADKDSRDGKQGTPLHRAAYNRHAPVVRVLMEAGADATLLNQDDDSPLRVADNRDGFGKPPEVVKTIIGFGVALNLHEAIKFGGNEELANEFGVKEGLASSLVGQGASVSDKDENGDTPLHIAASKGSVGITLLLLQRGADKDSRDGAQGTPLHRAALCYHTRVVRVLMEAGADATLRDGEGYTPLITALMEGYREDAQEVVETMIELGVDVNDADDDGWTPLHAAAFADHVECIDMLLAAGANIEARNSKGLTPLNLGVESIEVVRSLLNHGPDVNTQDNEGRTPLHHVKNDPGPDVGREYFNMDYLETVDLLLKAGADETVLDSKGRTAADKLLIDDWMCEWGQQEDVHAQITRAGELLANAPADRADRRWRRRALLFMCIARHRRGEAQLLDDAAGSANDDWTRVAAWVLDAGLEMGKEGIFRTIVMYL